MQRAPGDVLVEISARRAGRELGRRTTRARRNCIRDESGQVLVLSAVALSALMGFMALAVDVGQVLFAQHQLQTVADAAALAGALEIKTCGATANCPAMRAAATAAVTENGYSTPTLVTQCGSTGSGLTLVLNNGPCALGASDPNTGNTQYVEAVVSESQPTMFASVLGFKSFLVSARSEATLANSPSSACLIADGIAFNSAGNLSMTCGVQDNGNLQTDPNDSVTTTSFVYAGSWSPNNCGTNCTFSGASPKSGASMKDPLSSLTPPIQPAISSTNTQTPTNGETLQPGYYPNGFNLNSGVSVSLSPGVYYMGNSINVDSGASLTGTGVTLYFTSGSLQPNSGSTVQLAAPTTGSNAAMLVWQSSTNSSGMDMDANSSSYLQGIVYLPDAELTLNSGSGVTVNGGAAYTIVDVNSLIINSDETFDIGNNYSSLPGGPPVKTFSGNIALVE